MGAITPPGCIGGERKVVFQPTIFRCKLLVSVMKNLFFKYLLGLFVSLIMFTLQEPLVRKVEPVGSGTFIGPERKTREMIDATWMSQEISKWFVDG